MTHQHKTHWWQYIYLDFGIRLPFIRIYTRMLTKAFDARVYDICNVEIEVWKWQWRFRLYKRSLL